MCVYVRVATLTQNKSFIKARHAKNLYVYVVCVYVCVCLLLARTSLPSAGPCFQRLDSPKNPSLTIPVPLGITALCLEVRGRHRTFRSTVALLDVGMGQVQNGILITSFLAHKLITRQNTRQVNHTTEYRIRKLLILLTTHVFQ